MQQIMEVWSALDLRKRITVVLATLIVFGAVLGMTRLAGQPRFVLLYAGLEDTAAGQVVEALERQGQPYEVRGTSIFVDAAARDQLRLSLASEGLPENNGAGYELLDQITGFGTTSQMFDAAYWRAKEGELARTILSMNNISSARVHIANTGGNPFRQNQKPSAAVTISTRAGGLDAGQARALRHLVASAVAGLDPDSVSIIHGTDGLIGADDAAGSVQSAEDRATALRDKVQRLVEARVGPGNAVVEVSVETVTEQESIFERSFDPEGRVVISSDTEERSTSSEDSGGGSVTVASNLPDGDAAGNESSTSQNAETRERLNFEVSETTRELMRQPGGIRRLSVAVLVNGTFEPATDGSATFAPLPETELEALRELVASAVGFDAARGDVITLKSLAFEKPQGLGTEAIEPGWAVPAVDTTSVIQAALLALVALVVALFVLRPLLRRPEAVTAAALPAALPGPAFAEDLAVAGGPGLTGEIDTGDGFAPLPDLGGRPIGSLPDPGSEDPVERLRGLISDRREETVEILRSWLDETEPSDAR